MNRMRKLLGKKILLAVVLAVFTGGLVRAQEVKDTLTLTLDKALEIALSENPTMRVADQEIQLKRSKEGSLWRIISGSGIVRKLLAYPEKTDHGDGLRRRGANYSGRFGQLLQWRIDGESADFCTGSL